MATKAPWPPHPARINLDQVDQSLEAVVAAWPHLESQLAANKVGKKDPPFNKGVKMRMMAMYAHLDELLQQRVQPFSAESTGELLRMNELVHYGHDMALMAEYTSAIDSNAKKFYRQIVPIAEWYRRHEKRHASPMKQAGEVYAAILGQPQLFIEGNHRTGNGVADYILAYFGLPIFVLSVENAVAFFEPASQIKHFNTRSTWRGRTQLPQYKRRFSTFLEKNADTKYLLV